MADIRPKDIGLSSDSFSGDLPERAWPRVIVNVQAKQKVGKTDFALRFTPDPVVVFNFDNGLEGVVENIRSEFPKKRIIVAGVPTKDPRGYPSYHFARPMPERGQGRKNEEYLARVKKAAYPIWERFIADLEEFYKSDARTGVIDTGGAAFALGKFAFHGMDKVTSKDDPYGQKGGELKAIFQGLVTDGLGYDKNMIWLHRVKEVWEGGQPSGKWTVDGYQQLPYEVQATIYLQKKVRRGEVERWAEIVETRLNPKLEGERFEGDDCAFDVIASELTRTKLKEWA